MSQQRSSTPIPWIIGSLITAACGFTSSATAAHLTLDLGAPIDNNGNISERISSGVAAEAGAEWVRLNFILGPWNSPEDPSQHGNLGLSWEGTYQSIIDQLLEQGLRIYALVGAEAVHSSASNVNSDQWVADYTYNFVAIVDRFRDQIEVYESFNEPNNWAAGTSQPTLSAYYFALALQEIYLNTKYYNGHSTDPSWNVTLVSGPLFTHDQDTGASYLDETYNNGRSFFAWDWIYSTYGTYPLDGIGYHLYVAQGTADSSAITAAMDSNLNAVWNVITSREGAATPKRLWVSELGWNSDYIGEASQAANVSTGMNHLLADSRVALATWFTTQDWSGNAWGLFRTSGLSESDRKDAFYAFADLEQTGGDDGGPSCMFQSGSILTHIPGGMGIFPLSLYAVIAICRRRQSR